MATLITGASTGIGYAFAEAWLDQDNQLLLISRNPQRLQQAKKQLLSLRPQAKIETLAVDLSQDGSVKKITQWLDQKKFQVDTLINNAGIGYLGEFPSMPSSTLQEIIHLNVSSLSMLTYELLQRMKSGKIINIASMVGFTPAPLMNVYGASKAYVLSFSRGLEKELRHSEKKIAVYTVCPGTTKTPFFDRAGETHTVNREKGIFKLNRSMEPSQVVQETLLAIKKGKTLIIPGRINRILAVFSKFLPSRWSIAVSYYLMKSGMKK